MKRTSVVIVGLLILLPKLSGQESALKLYGIRSGIIEYSYAGDMGKMLF